MPDFLCRPNGIGYSDQWNLGAGANKYAAMDPGDPISHDDGTTGLDSFSGHVNFIQAFTLTDLPSYVIGVNSVKFGYRFSNADSITHTVNVGPRLGGTNNLSVVASLASGAGYTTTGPTTTTRPGGGSWSVSDVNSMEGVCQLMTDPVTTVIRHTSLWAEVDGDIPAGGFVCVVSSLVGAALGLAEMAKLAQAAYRRTRTLITPDEYVAAWREIRSHRRPKTFVMAA